MTGLTESGFQVIGILAPFFISGGKNEFKKIRNYRDRYK